jgi:hypothetical protein
MKTVIFITALFIVSCAGTRHGFVPLEQFADGAIYGRHDAFTNVTYYRHKEFLPGVMKGTNPAEVYITRTASGLKPRIMFTYVGREWLFMSHAILANGTGNNIRYGFNDWDVKREVLSGGYVKETWQSTFTQERAVELLMFFGTGTPSIQLSGEKRAEYTFANRHVLANVRMLQEYIKRGEND